MTLQAHKLRSSRPPGCYAPNRFPLTLSKLQVEVPIGLDPVAVLPGNHTWRSNYTGDVMSYQAIMKPESKISGCIDRLQWMVGVAS